MAFEFKKTAIEDVILIEPTVHNDSRGFFSECYKKSEFYKAGIMDDFVQDNHSKSSKGTLRGLHYQGKPYAQAKLIRCVKGAAYDVALDIRRNSVTFGKWVGAVLSEENKNILYIPKGFAHGFVALVDDTEMVYKASEEYNAEHDRGILWNDPDLGINLNINSDGGIEEISNYILSEKDKALPCLKDIKEEDLL